MKFRRTKKVGKFEFKKVINKGAVSKNVVCVAISPSSPYCQLIIILFFDVLTNGCCSNVDLQSSCEKIDTKSTTNKCD